MGPILLWQIQLGRGSRQKIIVFRTSMTYKYICYRPFNFEGGVWGYYKNEIYTPFPIVLAYFELTNSYMVTIAWFDIALFVTVYYQKQSSGQHSYFIPDL